MFPDRIMFCTDDSEPHEIKNGQPLDLVRRGVSLGFDLMPLLRAAITNPYHHYNLNRFGLLREGDPADFISVDNLFDFNVLSAYKDGRQIVKNGQSTHEFDTPRSINNFHAEPISVDHIRIPAADGLHTVRVIDVLPGQIITRGSEARLEAHGGHLHPDPDRDILKLVVLNRYLPDAKPSVVFVRNFGIKHGAIAGSIAHDCHNVIAVGSDDQSIVEAINIIVGFKGGVSLVGPKGASAVPLPIGGLMSDLSHSQITKMFGSIEKKSKELGTTLPSAYMALSFLALLVIPELKVSDKVGLFDAQEFKPVSLFG